MGHLNEKQNKIRTSLRFSFLDGVFSSCMSGLTADYIAPYALALNASTGEIGALSAIPNLSSALVQLKSADLTEKFKSRKRIINLFVLLQALMLLPILLIPYLFKTSAVLFLIIFITLFSCFGSFAGPPWASLLSDHIPMKSRGRYFGWRNKMLLLTAISAAYISGFVLNHFKRDVFKGFMIIIGIAFVCRLISWYYINRMYEPPFKTHKDTYFSFFDFIKRARESNFVRFVIFVSSLNFCVSLAGPFFSVYMLKDLRFSYLTYTIVVTMVTITHIFTIDRWGRAADKVGNVKVMRFTSFFIITLPLWWVISHSPLYLIFAQIISGFAWSGFNLSASNFIYDAVAPEKLTRCIAYFNVCNGSAIFFGAMLGGYLINILPATLGYKILSIFVISSILRLLVVFSFLGKIKEVRQTEKMSSKNLFYSVVGIKPVTGVAQSLIRFFKED